MWVIYRFFVPGWMLWLQREEILRSEIQKCNNNEDSLGANKNIKAIIRSDGNECSFLYEGFSVKNEFRNFKTKKTNN